MAIAFSKYVNITSGVGAGIAVPTRNFMGRIITSNVLLPTSTYLEFTSAALVGNYFGTSSSEYALAQFYFSWINKTNQSPNTISFVRWSSTNSPPRIFGAKNTTSLSAFQAITNGAIIMYVSNVPITFTGLNFSSIVTYADVATVLQTAFRANANTQLATCTVTFNPTTNNFIFVGSGTPITDTISAGAAGLGTEIVNLLEWNSAEAIYSNGQATQSITDVLTMSDALSDNYGSYYFLDTLTLAQETESATWNNSLNVKYVNCVKCPSASASLYSPALINLEGTAVTISDIGTQYSAIAPMLILAATDYTQPNAVQNYMFQNFPQLTPSVTDTATALSLDALRVNYIGQTQTAGQFLSFYQNGYLMGPGSAPVDMNTYVNEMWFKDSVAVGFMSLFLNTNEVPANATGVTMMLNCMQSSIQHALTNGVILTGKTLTQLQQNFITTATGDPTAWYQVQNLGYWLSGDIVSFVNTAGITQYQFQYTFIYSKNDVIRSVVGTHDLI